MSFVDNSNINDFLIKIVRFQEDLDTIGTMKGGGSLSITYERRGASGEEVARLIFEKSDAWFWVPPPVDQKASIYLKQLNGRIQKINCDGISLIKSVQDKDQIKEIQKRLSSLKASLGLAMLSLKQLNLDKKSYLEEQLFSDLDNLTKTFPAEPEEVGSDFEDVSFDRDDEDDFEPISKEEAIDEMEKQRKNSDFDEWEQVDLFSEAVNDRAVDGDPIEDGFLLIEKPESLSNISKLIDKERVNTHFETLRQYSVNYEDRIFRILDNKPIRELIRKIETEDLSNENEEKIALFLTDLLFLTAYNLSIKDKDVLDIEPIYVNQCQTILENLLSNIQNKNIDTVKNFYDERSSIFHQLLFFSTLNLSPRMQREVFRNDYFQETLKASPHYLKAMIFASQTHIPQIYRQTCVGTSYNRSLQKRVFVLPTLIVFAREMLSAIEEKLSSMSSDEKEKPAFELSSVSSVSGREAPTKEEYAFKRINQARSALEKLESEYRNCLLARREKSEKEFSNLYETWNFMVQYLYSVIDLEKPKIFSSHQRFPTWYYTSAIISGLLDTMQDMIPTEEPNSRARGRRGIERQDLQPLESLFFGQDLAPLKGRNPINNLDLPEQLKNRENSINGIWEELSNRGYGILHLSGLMMNRSSGHAIYIQACGDEFNKRFLLSDPMKSHTEVLSLKEAKKLFERELGCYILSSDS
ncbi:MAG: hypothetical protein WAM28_01750 [Chlamydiales bacterium]